MFVSLIRKRLSVNLHRNNVQDEDNSASRGATQSLPCAPNNLIIIMFGKYVLCNVYQFYKKKY